MKKLYIIAVCVALLFGCEQRTKIVNRIASGTQTNDSGAIGNIQNISAGLSGFQDIDSDGKLDLVFAIWFSGSNPYYSYYVFYKRNLGDGNFGEPKFIFATERILDSGIPHESIELTTARGRYYEQLLPPEYRAR